MTIKETEQLIQRYLDGETSPEEEHWLALEVNKTDAPKEWKMISEMLGELIIDEALFDQIMVERKAAETDKLKLHRMWPWMAAACVAAFLVIVLTPPRREEQPLAQQTEKVQKWRPQEVQQQKTQNVLQSPVEVNQLPAAESQQLAQTAVIESSVRKQPKANPTRLHTKETLKETLKETTSAEPVNIDEMPANLRERQLGQTYDYAQLEQEIRQKGEAFNSAVNKKIDDSLN